MILTSSSRAVLRFSAGTACGILAGIAVFGAAEVFTPRQAQFQVVTVGAFLALVLTVMRARAEVLAVAIAVAFAAYQFSTAWPQNRGLAISLLLWSLVIGAGILLIATIYEILDDRGFHLGKFLLLGPLLGGVYIAATPAAALWGVPGGMAMRSLLMNVFLGIIIGDGVGFGVEMADLVIRAWMPATADAAVPRSGADG